MSAPTAADAELRKAKAKLKKVLARIEDLHDAERKAVFDDAMKSQSSTVCAHVAALKASRAAGLDKLREFSSAAKRPSRVAAAGKKKKAAATADKKKKAAAATPDKKKKKKAAALPCEDVTTVNKLIRCLETCCKKFESGT